MSAVEVRKNERGAWCIYVDGQFVSDHRTHESARIAAITHAAAVSALPEEP